MVIYAWTMPTDLAEESPPEHVLALLHRLRQRTDADIAPRFASLPGMRGSFGHILGILPSGGARPTALAAQMGITKQSFGERVRELEQRGWVEAVPDPDDGRAQLIRRTPEGDRVREITEKVIASMENDWADQVGRTRYETFLSVLKELGEQPTARDA
jgi:DNA-binding MarR family transcriptional regulator